mmetsp:Transcript_120479/g.221583  ORF Transcript_120479/g.221583 Transcript_120479/m.221583 type:complete len:131 (+) Transcript_120479:775-1167(+)
MDTEAASGEEVMTEGRPTIAPVLCELLARVMQASALLELLAVVGEWSSEDRSGDLTFRGEDCTGKRWVMAPIMRVDWERCGLGLAGLVLILDCEGEADRAALDISAPEGDSGSAWVGEGRCEDCCPVLTG